MYPIIGKIGHHETETAGAAARHATRHLRCRAVRLVLPTSTFSVCAVSTHHDRTRMKAVQGGKPARVMGCLLGHQHGRVVAIVNSFEVTQAPVAGGTQDELVINHDFLRKRQDQCTMLCLPRRNFERLSPSCGECAPRTPSARMCRRVS